MKTSKRKRTSGAAGSKPVQAAPTPAGAMVEPSEADVAPAASAASDGMTADPVLVEVAQAISESPSADPTPDAASAGEPVPRGIPSTVVLADDCPVSPGIPLTVVLTDDCPVSRGIPLTVVLTDDCPVIVLAANCSVKDAAGLKSSLNALAHESGPVTVDARAVERVDTATMQLLCAFVRDRASAERHVAWLGMPKALQEAARLLGIGQLLQLNDTLPDGAAA